MGKIVYSLKGDDGLFLYGDDAILRDAVPGIDHWGDQIVDDEYDPETGGLLMPPGNRKAETYSWDDLDSALAPDAAKEFLEEISVESVTSESLEERYNESDYPPDVLERQEDVRHMDSYMIPHNSSPFEKDVRNGPRFVDTIEYRDGSFSVVGEDVYFDYTVDILESDRPARAKELKIAQNSFVSNLNGFFSKLV
ncbi:MAG: hypothetical protein ABEJ99_02005 [Candidatus Nanohaloarchaea archaeon]